MNQRHEVLFAQLETYRQDILDILEEISEEEADIVPKGFKNNIRWNMGHIYLDQYLWIQAVTSERNSHLKEFNTWFGFGTAPADFTSETPTFHELKLLLKEQPNRIKQLYGNRLEEEFTPTEMGMHTIEQVLIRTIFHEGMHLQAIMDIRKLL
ncbi:DinB family protein [Cytobacillus purgationiresistens]|uniref:Damage-inducible protein DinB n=1 Tax=Cytobacillus purgationiresistens TaxID=863449 RepID=A0ABU0AJ45_9BACI|nr:DinB family protein [Cytobacillus purgationiresistens]MDQ0271283.1 putative damage-inducible protein DinB [Cytobacillus purgationiresistens]